MADFKQISVLASGNPAGNAGVGPIVIFNNPQFEVGNDTHGGLGDNDYYFSLKIERNYTVYKLIKNNVRSFQAVRGGYLAIAFSIPRGYELVATNPYRVLMDLWNKFRDSCMSLKDPANQIYEFNSRNIDKDVLNEVAGGYALRATNKAYRPMNSQSSQVGLVVRPEEKIEELLKDVQYPEFSSFKEILIAEQANNTTNYSVLPGIQIPRPVSYAVVVDGMQRDSVADINKVIEVSSALNPVFYQNDTKKFSVSELQDGRLISGVTLDEANEQVVVSTDGWASPKSQKYHIRITPQDGEVFFFQNKELLQVSKGGRRVQLDANLDFDLTGEEIAYVTSGQIVLGIADNKKYRQKSQAVFKGNDICVTVEKIPEQKPIISPTTATKPDSFHGKRPIPKKEKETPFVTVKLSLNRSLLEEIKSDRLKVRCRVDNETLQTTQVRFTTSVDRSHVEGCLFVPKEWRTVYIGYKIGNVWYDSVNPVNFRKDEDNFTEKDFKRGEQSSGLFSKRIVMIVCALLLFFGGGVTGYFSRMHSEKAETEEDRGEDENEKLNVFRDFLEKETGSLTKIDVTFNEIYNIKEKYDGYVKEISEDQMDGILSNSKHNEICKRIVAYDSLARSIEQCKVGDAKRLACEPLIDEQHVNQVRKLNSSNIVDVTSFVDIREPLVSTPDSTPVASSVPVTKPSTPSTPPAARSTGTGELVSSKGWNGKPAYFCKENIASGGKKGCIAQFLDKEGLLSHIKKGEHQFEK